MTQSEFIKGYCERSEVTEYKLNELGQFAFPCKCPEDSCQGWQMTNNDGVVHEYKMGRLV